MGIVQSGAAGAGPRRGSPRWLTARPRSGGGARKTSQSDAEARSAVQSGRRGPERRPIRAGKGALQPRVHRSAAAPAPVRTCLARPRVSRPPRSRRPGSQGQPRAGREMVSARVREGAAGNRPGPAGGGGPAPGWGVLTRSVPSAAGGIAAPCPPPPGPRRVLPWVGIPETVGGPRGRRAGAPGPGGAAEGGPSLPLTQSHPYVVKDTLFLLENKIQLSNGLYSVIHEPGSVPSRGQEGARRSCTK